MAWAALSRFSSHLFLVLPSLRFKSVLSIPLTCPGYEFISCPLFPLLHPRMVTVLPKLSVIDKSNIFQIGGMRTWLRFAQYLNPIKAKVRPGKQGTDGAPDVWKRRGQVFVDYSV